MAKAVLIMDMPDKCIDCDLWRIDDDTNEDYCGAWNTGYGIIDDVRSKPDWCPLVELPERHIPDINEIQGFSDKSDNFGAEAIIGYYAGWNACLDALEGKENE